MTNVVLSPIEIVVLEDNSFDVELIQEAISAGGLRATFHAVADEPSFRRALAERCDLVLADYNLPGITALDALDIIKDRAPGVPLIVVTGSVGDEAAAECIKRGATDYILKHALARLPRAISSALTQRTLHTTMDRAVSERNASERLRMAILESALDCVIGIDMQGRVIEFNAAAQTTFGYRREDVLGRPIADLIIPERYRQDHLDGLKAYIRSGRSKVLNKRFEIEALRSDGSEFPVELAISKVDLPSGVVFTAALRDISERKAMESQLQDSEARFRSLVQNSRDVIAVIDVSGQFSYVSPAITDVSGFVPAEIVGRSGFEFIHPDDLEITVTALGEIVAAPARTKTVEVRTRTKTGGWVWIEIRAVNKMHDPSIRGIVLNYHDITERRVAADRIAASESSLVEAQAISHIGSFSWNMNTNQWSWSDEEYWLFGFEPGSVSPNLEAMLAAVHPDDREWVSRKRLGCIENEEPFDADFRVVLPDGSIRWIHGTAETAIENGVAVRRIGVHQDITARKEAELDQRMAAQENERLEVQLRKAHKMEAVGRLAGGVAHDFNNILAVVLNYAEFVAESLGEDHEGQADLKQIIKAGERGAELVHQLLAFSRQEVIQPTVIDLNDVVAGMAMLLSRSVGEEIELEVDSTPDLAKTKADFGQLEQILMNLVMNARDSMPDGGRIKIATCTADLDIGERVGLTAGRYVCLTVTDTGRGIAPETLEHIFEPFFTTKARGEGTGLGLATVYGIVQQAQGGIYAESEVGVMTAFHVYLPVTDEEITVPIEHWSPEVVDRATILVVEDEAPVRELIGRILRREGFDVVDVGSGAEAVAICSVVPCKIDLLLTDVVMPHMSGPALRDIVQPLYPDMKVLFMSGYTDELIAKRGVLDAGDSLLNKPFNSHQLLARVRQSLHQDEPLSSEIVEAAL